MEEEERRGGKRRRGKSCRGWGKCRMMESVSYEGICCRGEMSWEGGNVVRA